MLGEQFRNDRARLVRHLADQADDPFIKSRLLKLVERYEGEERRLTRLNTPADLQITGEHRRVSER